MIEIMKTNGAELVKFVSENPWLTEDGFSINRDSSFPQKVEFLWTPDEKKFNTSVESVRCYIDEFETVTYETLLNLYVKLNGKKSMDAIRTEVLPMYDDETKSNDYSDIRVNFFYTMYNVVYHYAKEKVEQV